MISFSSDYFVHHQGEKLLPIQASAAVAVKLPDHCRCLEIKDYHCRYQEIINVNAIRYIQAHSFSFSDLNLTKDFTLIVLTTCFED